MRAFVLTWIVCGLCWLVYSRMQPTYDFTMERVREQAERGELWAIHYLKWTQYVFMVLTVLLGPLLPIWSVLPKTKVDEWLATNWRRQILDDPRRHRALAGVPTGIPTQKQIEIIDAIQCGKCGVINMVAVSAMVRRDEIRCGGCTTLVSAFICDDCVLEEMQMAATSPMAHEQTTQVRATSATWRSRDGLYEQRVDLCDRHVQARGLQVQDVEPITHEMATVPHAVPVALPQSDE